MLNRMIFSLIFCACSYSCSAQSKIVLPCWLSGDYSKMITSQESMLKSYLLAINLDQPIADAKIRIKNGDYRLIGIGGIGVGYPGLNLKIEGDILCELGGRYLMGTSDGQEGRSHAALILKFGKYAEKYNAEILRFYRSRR